jgi:hypothetical protein
MEFVGLEVLTPVVIKSSIFWDIMPSSPLKVNRRFGGLPAGFLLGLFFGFGDGGNMFF